MLSSLQVLPGTHSHCDHINHSATKQIDDRWLPTRCTHLLLQKNFQKVQVDITDERGLRTPACYPVDEADSIYPVWEDVCRRIIEPSDLRQWISLECYRYRREDDPTYNPPAVLLSVYLLTGLRPATTLLPSSTASICGTLLYTSSQMSFYGESSLSRKVCCRIRPVSRKYSRESVSAFRLPRTAQALSEALWSYNTQHPSGAWRTFGITCFHVTCPQRRWELSDEDNAGMVFKPPPKSSPSLDVCSFVFTVIRQWPQSSINPARRCRENSPSQPS